MNRSKFRLLLLAFFIASATFTGLVVVPSIRAQEGAAVAGGVYKGWSVAADGRSLDSTLSLNADGSVSLVDDRLDGTVPVVRTGNWTSTGADVVLTLTHDAAGPLAQALTVTLGATPQGTLLTAAGDSTLGERGRQFIPFAQIVAERNSLSFSADLARWRGLAGCDTYPPSRLSRDAGAHCAGRQSSLDRLRRLAGCGGAAGGDDHRNRRQCLCDANSAHVVV